MSPRAPDRDALARAAADALDGARECVASFRAFIGFDGNVDSIIRAVDKRRGPDDFDAMKTIEQLAQRVAGAAGKSVNVELVVEKDKLGGNGPLMSDAIARLGAQVHYVGALGDRRDPARVHDVLQDFAGRCATARIAGCVGLTDAVEFTDGKVMLGKVDVFAQITWERVLEVVGGLDALVKLLDGASLVSAVSWTMVPHLEQIWAGLTERALPRIEAARRPGVFIDLADPAKKTEDDLQRALKGLQAMNAVAPVALGLNLSESARLARALGLAEPATIEAGAEAIRAKMGLACVVVHRRQGAAAATREERATFAGPFLHDPPISTGAGDHFNGGFATAWRLGLPIAQCLAVAAGLSGWYVRNGRGPSLDELIGFLRELPPPE